MLSVEDVHLYYGASHVLRGVSLKAMLGRVTCVLGRNGVGKTSLLRAILGLEPVPSGQIVWEDEPLGGKPPYARARTIPDEVFELFPVLKDMLRRRGGDLSGGQQQQLALARALVTRPRLPLLDEPTEGIQPSIIKQIGEVIARLAARGEMAILLVEQYLEFAREVADDLIVMDRGEVVVAGAKSELDEGVVKRYLTV